MPSLALHYKGRERHIRREQQVVPRPRRHTPLVASGIAVRRISGFALPAVQHPAERGGPGIGGQYPRAIRPRRVVAHVLEMSALEFGHPVAFLVLVEARDASVRHRTVPQVLHLLVMN